MANQPTRLADEEIREVRTLVLANQRVRSALSPPAEKVELAPMVFEPAKVALVQFKSGETYRALPFAVIVDLRGQRVPLAESDPKAAHAHP